MTDKSKYQGFNLITFNANNFGKDSSISINCFNFSLYNSADWNNEINGGDIWKIPYKNCSWYNIACHIENAGIWLANNLHGMKDVYNFVNGIYQFDIVNLKKRIIILIRIYIISII